MEGEYLKYKIGYLCSSFLHHHQTHPNHFSQFQYCPKMAAPVSKQTLVALAAGTHTWVPTPESEATQDEIVAILRKHGITNLDTARSYVRILVCLKVLYDFTMFWQKFPVGWLADLKNRAWERLKKRLETKTSEPNSMFGQRLPRVWAAGLGKGRISSSRDGKATKP